MEYLCYAFPAAAAGLLVARAQKKQPTSSSSVTLRIINVTDVYMLDNFPCVIVDCIFLFFQRNVCVLLTQVLFPSLLPLPPAQLDKRISILQKQTCANSHRLDHAPTRTASASPVSFSAFSPPSAPPPRCVILLPRVVLLISFF